MRIKCPACVVVCRRDFFRQEACVRSRGHILYIDKVLIPLKAIEKGHEKTRSLGQILGKYYVHSRGHVFTPIFIKVAQNVYLDQLMTPNENVCDRVKN